MVTDGARWTVDAGHLPARSAQDWKQNCIGSRRLHERLHINGAPLRTLHADAVGDVNRRGRTRRFLERWQRFALPLVRDLDRRQIRWRRRVSCLLQLKNPPIFNPRPPTQNVAESVENYFRTFVHEVA